MKKFILIVLLLIPFVVDAACNNEKHYNNINNSKYITYDNNYSESSKTFEVTLYAISDNMTVKYNNKTYPVENNSTTISGIREGTNMNIEIYADDGCSAVRNIYINEPYYNEYYGKDVCKGYEKILTGCSSQFTKSKVTLEYIQKSISNYLDTIESKEEPEEVAIEPTLLDKVIDFMLNWGIKIILFLATSLISTLIYTRKFDKLKHGI